MGIRMWRRLCLVVVAAAFCALGTVYVTFFQRSPAADILAANKASISRRSLSRHLTGADDNEAAIVQYQAARWDAWVEANNYVPIGDVFDKCTGDDRLTLGKLIMLTDKKGGLKARLHVNATMEEDITEGGIHINILYNARQLYHNTWDLCTAEDREMEAVDRVLACPMVKGRLRVIKTMSIPSFIPKGRYSLEVSVSNQDEKMVYCALVDFTLS